MLLQEALKKYNVILASGSPRRRELLAGCDIDFSVASGYDVQEVYPDTLPVEDVPLFLANLKSNAYPHELTAKDILITADTIVALDGAVLGKPAGRDDAIDILRRLSGNRHRVITGVVIRTNGQRKEFTSVTDVWFKSLTDEQIAYYIDKYRPYDKAGAYGIQEWIGYTAIERIEGSFYNVMGLPTRQLCTTLEEFI